MVRNRVRVRVRFGSSDNITIYPRSNCRRSMCRTFVYIKLYSLVVFGQILFHGKNNSRANVPTFLERRKPMATYIPLSNDRRVSSSYFFGREEVFS